MVTTKLILWKNQKIRDGFQFPEEVDAASIGLDDIVKMLPKPSSVATTKRLSGVLKFGIDLATYGFWFCLSLSTLICNIIPVTVKAQ